MIDVFGADHHGQVPACTPASRRSASTRDRLEIRSASSSRSSAAGCPSARGNFVKLDELIDEIGPDATRLLSLLNSIDQATTLDLDLVKRQSMENPVFYVQYAHARIASIDRKRAERGIERVPLARSTSRCSSTPASSS